MKMLIMEQKDDDTHLCLRCSKTIVGLENYVTHRQQNCLGILSSPESKEKDLSADVPQSCVVVPLSSSPTQSLSWDVPLTASDFFSCLELQSTVNAPRTDISPSIPSQQFSCVPKTLRDNVLELPSGSGGMNCPSFDDVEECDQGFFSECEGNSTEFYPPRTHTGGKWKPGSRPHLKNRQQWGVHNLQPVSCDSEQNIRHCVVQNVQVCSSDCVIDGLNFECHTTENNSHVENTVTCPNALVESHSSARLNNQVNDSTDVYGASAKHFPYRSFNCDYCNEECPDQFSYTLHLFSLKHKKHFLDVKDYCTEIFRHERMLIRTILFQCQVCSFYYNDIGNFLSHIKSSEHNENAGTETRFMCLPLRFQFEMSEEIAKQLLQNFTKAAHASHPVVILKNEVPLFCNFCTGKCHYLQISKARQRKGHKNMKKHKSANHKKLFKKCAFCNRNFILKKYKKHLKACTGKPTPGKEEMLKSVTEKEYSNINFGYLDSFASISKARSVSGGASSKVKAVTIDTDLCRKKHATKSVHKNDSNHLSNTKQSEELFYCSLCEKQFPHKMGLLKHKKFHFGKQMHKCSKCDFQAVKRCLLRRHEESHSDNRPRPFICEICGSSQLYKCALMQHMRLHSEGTFRCDSNGCQHVCRTQAELTRHRRVHTNERPYHCKLCSYSARTAHQLKKHQRTHTGERPFKCTHCSYSASLSHQLLRHMRVHTGSKPYKCPYCDYVCNNHENIRKHILKTKKHEGEKMYPCTFCSFGCNDFPEFQKHLLCSHKEHFPKGLKDVDSSMVAGLYKRDFPRSEPPVKDGFT